MWWWIVCCNYAVSVLNCYLIYVFVDWNTVCFIISFLCSLISFCEWRFCVDGIVYACAVFVVILCPYFEYACNVVLQNTKYISDWKLKFRMWNYSSKCYSHIPSIAKFILYYVINSVALQLEKFAILGVQHTRRRQWK